MKIKKTSNASYTNIYVNSVYGRSLKSFYGFPSLLNSYEFNPFWKMFSIVIVSFMNLYFHSSNQLYDFILYYNRLNLFMFSFHSKSTFVILMDLPYFTRKRRSSRYWSWRVDNLIVCIWTIKKWFPSSTSLSSISHATL